MSHPHPATARQPVSLTGSIGRTLLAAAAGSCLLAIAAQIRVPMLPVPMTMQTFAVMLIGLTFGARQGAAACILYLLEGAAGLPVFTGAGAGIGHLTGATGGYLLSFPLAACAIARLGGAGQGRGTPGLVASLAAGLAIIFGFGATWLSLFVGAKAAIMAGVVPFLLGEALKAALAGCLAGGVRVLRGR